MRVLGLALLSLAALAPLGAAGALEGHAGAPAAHAGCAAAPCGWINPLIRLDFPQKPLCGAGQVAAELDRSECMALPAAGGSIALDGTLVWYWDITYEGTYPNDPATDIQVSFSGTSSNPGFLDIAVEPEGFAISTADLFDPARLKVDQADPSQVRVYYWYEVPIHVTLTRAGDPTPEELARVQAKEGIASFYLKAKSTESSDRYKAAFGVEEFRLDASADPAFPAAEGNDAPASGLLLGLAGVALALLSRRR